MREICASGHIQLETVTANEWKLWRALRLAALEEAPYAFGSRLVDWQGAGDLEIRWRNRLSTVPLNVVARLNGIPSGMVSATNQDEGGTLELISMWVAPAARGYGLGDALVRAGIGWAQEQGAARISLDVVANNNHAAMLYRRHGFIDVGPVMDHEAADDLLEHRMVRDLTKYSQI